MKNTKGVISLFSGALGLDLGLEKAKFELLTAVDSDKFVIDTINNNKHLLRNKSPIVYQKSITTENIKSICNDIKDTIKGNNVKPFILAGAPPCQPFSTAGKRMSMLDYRSIGIFVFMEAVKILKPRYFVIENVKGIISAAKKHRPLAQRGPGFPPLSPEEEYGSAFFKILNDLKKLAKEQRYCITWGIINAADYGCPQSRERLIIIGSLDGHHVWPKATHANIKTKSKSKWVSLKKAFENLKEENPVFENFSTKTKKYLKLINAGENWKALPSHMQKDAIGGAYESWGGRSGFLRRLAWDKPAPTITSCPTARATMLCHPTEIRPLSVRECARIQQFPDGWQFVGHTAQQYKQIGNATPIAIGVAIGKEILMLHNKGKPGKHKGKLFCADRALLDRIIQRPTTQLNPKKMRRNKNSAEAKTWLDNAGSNRCSFNIFNAIDDFLLNKKSSNKTSVNSNIYQEGVQP